MTLPDKTKIAHSFANASQYDSHAQVQRQVAALLADKILQEVKMCPQDVLEIGCGTGALSTHLVRLFPQARFLFTDLVSAMLQRCESRLLHLSGVQARFAVMDGEHPSSDFVADLVVSSMVFQWFSELSESLLRLSRCVRPGGHLIFATLGERTFCEWRGVHARLGLSCGSPDYPSAQVLTQDLARLPGFSHVEEQELKVRLPNATAFLREIKGVGAGLAKQGAQPFAPRVLKKLLSEYEHLLGNESEKSAPHGVVVTWHLLFGIFHKVS